ncbi:MAG: hypothetical protein NVS4B13_00280 [Candidatus Elarobacter sp.]
MPNPFQMGLQAIRNLTARRAAAEVRTEPAGAAGVLVAPVQMVLDQPVTTTTPQLVVAGMAPGTYTFRLFVTDERGAVSETTTCVVEVR